MQYANLSRDEVTRVIEGKGAAPRIPLLLRCLDRGQRIRRRPRKA